MNLDSKIEASQDMIVTMLARHRRPVVMCSFGKDSMVLLHLVRTVTQDIPILFHREPFMPRKYDFANQVIRDWNLTVYDYAPVSVAMVKNGEHLEIVNHYQNGWLNQRPTLTHLPTGIEPPEPGKPFLCGKADLIQKPCGTFNWPWDLAFHGHKAVDRDAVNGSIPLQADVVQNPNCDFVYPLREFNDADVWEYTERFKVPFQADRYDAEYGYAEFADKTANPDYFHCCTLCIDRDQPAVVTCPKDGLRKTNISEFVPYEAPLKRPYFQPEEQHGL